MGMVLPAFNALPQHFGKLILWLHDGWQYATRIVPAWIDRPSVGRSGPIPAADPQFDSPQLPWHRWSNRSQNQRPPLPSSAPSRQPPLRSNWPFTVRPAPAPTRPAPGASHDGRSLLVAAVGMHRLSAMSTATEPQGRGRAAPCAVRRFSEPASGRLALAGRMEDVCAELDRLVASEAKQRRQTIAA